MLLQDLETRRLLEEQDKVLRSYFAQKYDRGASRGEVKGHTIKPRGQEHLGYDVYARYGGVEAGPPSLRDAGGRKKRWALTKH